MDIARQCADWRSFTSQIKDGSVLTWSRPVNRTAIVLAANILAGPDMLAVLLPRIFDVAVPEKVREANAG
jgi:hypothetical protein